jgi:hypothetical protein
MKLQGEVSGYERAEAAARANRLSPLLTQSLCSQASCRATVAINRFFISSTDLS